MRRLFVIAGALITLGFFVAMGQPTTKPKTPTTPAPTPTRTPTLAPPGSGPTTAAPTPKGGPTGVADAYFAFLAAGRPFRAVDECFDTDAFARRVFQGDVDRIEPSEALFLKQLSTVFVKAAVSASVTSLKGGFQHDEFEVQGKGDEMRVTCMLTLGDDTDDDTDNAPTREVTLDLVRTDAGWKIADVEPMGKLASDAYSKARAQRLSPIVFMESMLGGLIKGKIDRDAPAAAPTRESRFDQRRDTMKAQLQTLANQIELFKTRTGHYPDLLTSGWDELIKAGLITQAPVNPVNGRSEICEGIRGKRQYGWCWDPKTGTLGASYFDEKTMALTPGTP
jgi:hypothetical protein